MIHAVRDKMLAVRSERTRFSSALSVGPRPCLFIKCTAYLHARTWLRVMYRDSSHVGHVGSGGKPKPGHRQAASNFKPSRKANVPTRSGFNQMDEWRQPIFAAIDAIRLDRVRRVNRFAYLLSRAWEKRIYIYKFCVDTSISFFLSILSRDIDIYFHTLVFFSKLKILVESIEDLLTIKVNKR